MNAQETTGIRELTAQEVDHVTGGTNYYNQTLGLAIGVAVGTVLSVVGGAIWNWLFGD